METVIQPDAVDMDAVKAIVQVLDEVGSAPRLVGPDGTSTQLPTSLYEVLNRAAHELLNGNGVTVMPLSAVLTTAQAAELLNVSRPFVVKLIDAGQLDHHMAGTHRRVLAKDVLEYQSQRDEERRLALEKMHEIADESEMAL